MFLSRFPYGEEKANMLDSLIMVTLTRADVLPTPPHQVTLSCPYCSRQYHLNYSDENWNKVGSLVKVANKAIREDHRNRHQKPSLDLDWNPPRLTRTSII